MPGRRRFVPNLRQTFFFSTLPRLSTVSATVTSHCRQYHCHKNVGRPRRVHALTMGPCPWPSPLGPMRGPWITFSGPPLLCFPGTTGLKGPPCKINVLDDLSSFGDIAICALLRKMRESRYLRNGTSDHQNEKRRPLL